MLIEQLKKMRGSMTCLHKYPFKGWSLGVDFIDKLMHEESSDINYTL